MAEVSDEYTNGEVLLSVRAFWGVRARGSMDSAGGVRMLDVSRAYDRLDTEERIALFLGVWLEREPVPKAVITRMRHLLNGD